VCGWLNTKSDSNVEKFYTEMLTRTLRIDQCNNLKIFNKKIIGIKLSVHG
jgi:hypothetical protein